MATFTSAANTAATEMDVISSIVQEELLQAALLRPTVTDLSSMAQKGIVQIDWPRFSSNGLSPAAQNADGETETAGQTAVFAVDSLLLNDWTSIPYEIPDRVSQQSMINLEAELAKSAGRQYGEYMDQQILVQLRLASTSAPDHKRDLDGAATHGAASSITLDGIAIARQLLNRANVPQSDRFLVIPPEQEKVIIGLDNFRNADKYGSRDALLSGEVGQIYGFRVIVHNGCASNECMAYHKSAVAVAVQQEVKFETRRATLKLQKTEYSFALGMGQKVLDGGRRQVYMLGA
jgi:hypothetical protein